MDAMRLAPCAMHPNESNAFVYFSKGFKRIND